MMGCMKVNMFKYDCGNAEDRCHLETELKQRCFDFKKKVFMKENELVK